MNNIAYRSGAIATIAVAVALASGSLAVPAAAQGSAATTTENEVTTDSRPTKSRGKAVQKVMQGAGNVCNDFKNDYTIVPGDEPGTSEMRRRFGPGVTDVQEQIFFDPTIGVVVFGDDSDQFDSLTILGLPEGSTRPRGFLLEGPDGSIDQDDLVERLEGLLTTDFDTWDGDTLRDQIRPIGEDHVRTVSNGCFWSSDLKPDKKSRKSFDDLVRWLTTSPEVGEMPPDAATLRLNGDRFQVEIEWAGGLKDDVALTPEGPEWTGFTFFDSESNLEVLVALLDRCSLTDTFWVFAAAATDVEYTLTVTDTQSSETRTYSNPLGPSAPAITDTDAFATCP